MKTDNHDHTKNDGCRCVDDINQEAHNKTSQHTNQTSKGVEIAEVRSESKKINFSRKKHSPKHRNVKFASSLGNYTK